MGYKQCLHTHSILCDGKDTLEEMVLTAIEKGFDSIGFSGHSFMDIYAEFSMSEEKVAKCVEMIREHNAKASIITTPWEQLEGKDILDTIAKDYEILLGELTQYNPELLDKQRLLAITKCDMLDDELIEQMRPSLPEGVPSVFISSVANMNITRLKDMLWEALQQ